MMHTKHFAAGRPIGLAFSLLLAIGGCGVGSSGSTEGPPCDDCGSSVTAPTPAGNGITDTPRLEVGIDDAEPGLSASLAATTVRVRPGADTTLEVRVDRSAYDGEVAVWAEGLPSGIVAEPAVMPGSVPTGRLVIGATEAVALGGPFAFTVVVSATGLDPVEVSARLVVAGAPGTLDETFGEGGVATLEGNVMVNAVAVDTRGRVVVTGRDWDSDGMLIERLGVDGTHDAAYGEAARATLPEDLRIGGSRMVMAGDRARLLISAKERSEPEGDTLAVLMALDELGRPDEAIGRNGMVAAAVLGPEGEGSYALAEGDGTVFFRAGERLGAVRPSGATMELALPDGARESWGMAYANHGLTFGVNDSDGTAPAMLERMHTAGGRDERFGEGGIMRGMASNAPDFASSSTFQVALLEDGSGFAGSIRWFADSAAFGELVRFTAEGRLDESFGVGGRVTFAGEGERMQGLVVDAAERPVTFTEQRPSFERRLRRYTPHGQLDRTFGDRGVIELRALGLGQVRRVGHDPRADRVVACGGSSDGWFCARFWL